MKHYIFYIILCITNSALLLLYTSCSYGSDSLPKELFNGSKEEISDYIDMQLEYGSLSRKKIACLVLKGCEIRDSLRYPILSDTLLIQACEYYSSASDYMNLGKCRYYLGRFYAQHQREGEAMHEYLQALALVDSARTPNLSGYICSYIADLYAKEIDTKQAFEYYKRAENLFRRAGNERSRVIAIRDQGYTYSLQLNHKEAIGYYLHVDSLLSLSSDSRLHSSVLNRLGFSYMKLNEMERAREYLKKSISLNPQNLSARFSLAKLDIKEGTYFSAQQTLYNLLDSFPDLASQHQIYDHLYRLEKSVGQYDSALYYLEKSNMYMDSLLSYQHNEELLSVEKKYQQEQIRTANMRLRLERNGVWLTCASLLILLIVTFLIYREELARKKRKALELQREAENHQHQAEKEKLERQAKEKEIQAKDNELIQKNNLINMVKEAMFRNSVLCHKIKLLSNLPIQNLKKKTDYQKAVFEIFGDPSFSEADKQKLYDVTNGLYPGFTDRLKTSVPSLTEDELQFCCLLMFGLSLNELAIILNIAVTTIKSKRYRIMAKAKMTNSNIKLEEYLHSIAEPPESTTN